MRVHVVHDKKGNVRALAVPAADIEGDVEIEAESGHTVSTFDVRDPDQEHPFDEWDRIVKRCRVEIAGGKAKLVEKKG